MSVQLDTPVQYVKGVGPQRAEVLAKAGIHTAEDLLRYRPFRYEDRTRFRKIAELDMEQQAVVQVEILSVGSRRTRRKGFSILEMVVSDDSGHLAVKFFNQPYLQKVFKQGQIAILFGPVRRDSYSGQPAFVNPEFEILEADDEATIHTGRIVPVYRRIGAVTPRLFRRIIFKLLARLEGPVSDPLPVSIIDKFSFPGRREAFQQIHFPDEGPGEDRDDLLVRLDNAQTPAHQRLIFEEFFQFQMGLELVRKQRQVIEKGRKIEISHRVREAVKAILPFRPTPGQKRVLKEIVQDLCSAQSMSRLLQGDVGSGKTIVALQAAVVVIENGYQVAFMAPTEILAEQHYRNINSYLSDSPYRVALLTSAVKGTRRKKILSEVRAGSIPLLIGTHALIQQKVTFHDLGLAVIDEQHRFGVVQRSELILKGDRPDLLVMTATPIPRSLALTLYGDLDLSILDDMPPGRKPVKTVVKADSSRDEVYELLRQEMKAGRQVYVVYPLVEESEKLDLKAATEMAKQLGEDVFPDFEVGLIHGRMKSEEKDEWMRRFKNGEVSMLVATTVIEVGIDIPNATVMVIEHAERFGLSQLHQLRGRVGRGKHSGLCILLVDKVRSKEAFQRLDIMRRSSDGFKLAERDLEIRGPGEFVGTRQSGVPAFHFGNIVRDRKWLELAQTEARNFLDQLVRNTPEGGDTLREITEKWRERYGLYEVG